MGLEVGHAFKTRIDKAEDHHRWQRRCRVVKHGELIHEIAVGMSIFDGARVALVGQELLGDSHPFAKETDLLVLGFEVAERLISKDEIERDESSPVGLPTKLDVQGLRV